MQRLNISFQCCYEGVIVCVNMLQFLLQVGLQKCTHVSGSDKEPCVLNIWICERVENGIIHCIGKSCQKQHM